MIASPRIQEYITWLAPKEKAGLYMGTNFLSLMIGGATSGVVYTRLYGIVPRIAGNAEYRVWYTLAAHTARCHRGASGSSSVWFGEFKEQEE